MDGNKRASFAALIVFLRLNEVRFSPDPSDAAAAILALAAGEIEEDGIERWVRDRSPSA